MSIALWQRTLVLIAGPKAVKVRTSERYELQFISMDSNLYPYVHMSSLFPNSLLVFLSYCWSYRSPGISLPLSQSILFLIDFFTSSHKWIRPNFYNTFLLHISFGFICLIKPYLIPKVVPRIRVWSKGKSKTCGILFETVWSAKTRIFLVTTCLNYSEKLLDVEEKEICII